MEDLYDCNRFWALEYLESDGEFYDNWTEMYRNRTSSPVSDEEKRWMKSRLEIVRLHEEEGRM